MCLIKSKNYDYWEYFKIMEFDFIKSLLKASIYTLDYLKSLNSKTCSKGVLY